MCLRFIYDLCECGVSNHRTLEKEQLMALKFYIGDKSQNLIVLGIENVRVLMSVF